MNAVVDRRFTRDGVTFEPGDVDPLASAAIDLASRRDATGRELAGVERRLEQARDRLPVLEHAVGQAATVAAKAEAMAALADGMRSVDVLAERVAHCRSEHDRLIREAAAAAARIAGGGR